MTTPPEDSTGYKPLVSPGTILRPDTLDSISRLDPEAQPNAVAMVALHAQGELVCVLRDPALSPEEKIAAVADLKEQLSGQIKGLPFGEGIVRVIQWLTTFRSSKAGLALYQKMAGDTPELDRTLPLLIQSDVLDVTNPAVFLGLMSYAEHPQQRQLLELLLLDEESGIALTQAQILNLLINCKDADFKRTQRSTGIVPTKETGDKLATHIARELLSFTLRNGDGLGKPKLDSSPFQDDDASPEEEYTIISEEDVEKHALGLDAEDSNTAIAEDQSAAKEGSQYHLLLTEQEASENFAPENLEEIFENVSEDTSRVMRAIHEYDPALFGELLREYIASIDSGRGEIVHGHFEQFIQSQSVDSIIRRMRAAIDRRGLMDQPRRAADGSPFMESY